MCVWGMGGWVGGYACVHVCVGMGGWVGVCVGGCMHAFMRTCVHVHMHSCAHLECSCEVKCDIKILCGCTIKPCTLTLSTYDTVNSGW